MRKSRLYRRLQRTIGRPIAEDVDRELDFHLEMSARELEVAGYSPSEAREESRRRFGDRPRIARSCRRISRRQARTRERSDHLDRVRSDLRFALRRWARQPGFALAAVLTLALGVGASSATFSLLHGILLEPLPFADAESLVLVWEVDDRGREMRVSGPNFEDWRDRATSFEQLAVYSGTGDTTVLGGSEPVRAAQTVVGRGFFEALGATTQLGRTFLPEEQVEGAEDTVVLSDAFWRRALGGNADLAQLRLEVSGIPHRVIGVLSPGLELPEQADLWTPKEIYADTSGRTAHNWRVIGRLSPLADREQAGAEMSAIAQRLAIEHAGDNDAADASVVSLQEELVGAQRTTLWLLFLAAGLLLLVACANLGGTLLAKAIDRQRELSIRAALGAGRGALVQQLLTEALLLSLLGGAGGLALAILSIRAIKSFGLSRLPRLDNVEIDPTVLVYTLVAAVVTGLLLSIAPGLLLGRQSLAARLGDSGRSGLGAGRARAWNVLTAGEVAIALILLVGCGLLGRSIWQLSQVELGFEPKNLAVLDLAAPVEFPPWGEDREPIHRAEKELAAFYNNFLQELESVPGVEGVAVTTRAPIRGASSTLLYLRDRSEDESPYAGYLAVSPSYFRVLGIPLLRGRGFGPEDGADAQHVTVISESLARRVWPNGDALGQQVRPPGMDPHGDRWLTVVGVVGDVRQRSLADEPTDLLYVSYGQRAFRTRWSSVLARTSGDPESVIPSLRTRIAELEPSLPLDFTTMSGVLGGATASARFNTAVMATFALVSLVLAAGGIWTVVAFQVARRRREMGIRLALGARPSRLVRWVLSQTMRVVAVGATLGLVGSLLLSRTVQSLLFEVVPGDPSVLAGAALLLVVVALTAGVLPARRAAGIDPLETLREE